MREKDQVWALFWCSLLRPLIEGETFQKDGFQALARKPLVTAANRASTRRR